MDQYTPVQLIQMVLEAEDLRQRGCIGDCLLREAARAWTDNLGLSRNFTDLMDVGREAYRRIALHSLSIKP